MAKSVRRWRHVAVLDAAIYFCDAAFNAAQYGRATVNGLLPNFGILRVPMNWLLVGFVLAIMSIGAHVIFKEKDA